MDITVNTPSIVINVGAELPAEALAGLAAIPALQAAVSTILSNTENIMATNQQAADKLDALGTTLDKISAETTGLVGSVADLKAAAEAGNVGDDVMAKIDALASKAASIDSMVDDVAPNPTPTPDPTDGPAEPGDTGTDPATGGGTDAASRRL